MPTWPRTSSVRARAAAPVSPRCRSRTSPICFSIVCSGLSERQRLLKHDGDVVAAHFLHVALGQRQKIAALEDDFARGMPRGRIGQELEDRQRGDRFAGARFADQGYRLTLADVERHVVDAKRFAAALTEADREIADGEERIGGHASSASRLSIPVSSGGVFFNPDGNFLKSASAVTMNLQSLRIAEMR